MKNLSGSIAYPAIFEDIVFQNKNKEYGAYILRKSYKKHMIIACFISLVTFTLSISSPLLLKKDEVFIKTTGHKYDTTTVYLGPPPDIDPETPEAVPKELISGINTVKFTIPKVVQDEFAVEDYVPTVQELENATPWTQTREGQAGGVDLTLLEPVETQEQQIVENNETQPVHQWAEVMPAYPGGDEGLYSFFSGEINYPDIAKKAGIEGRVILSFIVEKDGSVSNAKIARGIGGGCEEEALRVLQLCRKWHPGRQNGIPVRVTMMVPVIFNLN